MFRRKEKGFTLVEVLITLAIVGIIIPIIFTFFLTNYKTLNKSQIEVEVQTEGGKIIEKISNIAIQCSGINITTSDSDDKIDSINDSMEFIGNENHKFTLTSNNKILLDGVEFAQYIEYVACTKITNGVELEIKLKDKDVEKSISTTIYFRNAM